MTDDFQKTDDGKRGKAIPLD